jgi:hypothetical protein
VTIGALGGVRFRDMKRLAGLCAISLIATGCFGSKTSHVQIAADLPPAPKTWDPPPKFSKHSCWARPTSSPEITRVAPSIPARSGTAPTPPRELVRRLLARLGDRSLIRTIEVGPPPRSSKTRHVFPGNRPPRDALWAYISAPDALLVPSGQLDPERLRAYSLARWEAELVGGALRDDFCRAGGPPLTGWTLSREVIDGGVSDGEFALNQRFPNPSRREFRARLDLVGKRYGFKATSIRFLRPRELAPIVVVQTDRDPKEFIADVAEIVQLLNPRSRSGAVTFEGFFFEAVGRDGPFVRTSSVYRGEVAGRQWSAYSDTYPYAHG